MFKPRLSSTILRSSLVSLATFIVSEPSVAEVAAARQRIVLFTSADDPAFMRANALQASRAALAELGVDLGLEPRPTRAELAATLDVARRVAEAQRALAVVWVEVDGSEVSLYFFDSGRGRLLSRRVAVSTSEAAAAEELAIVLRSAANALLEGGAPEMTEVRVNHAPPSPPPAPPPAPAPRPVANDSARVALGGSYFASSFAADQGLESGVRLALATRPFAAELRFGAAYTWLPALTARSPGVEVRVTRHPAELWCAYEFGRTRLRIAPELALALDRVERATERVESPWVASPGSGRFLGSASLRARGLVNFAPHLWFTSSVGVAWVMNPFDQVAMTASSETRVLSVLAVRPELELGVRLDLF